MAAFDRTCLTSYQSAIVNVALSCTIFEIFDIEEYCGLEIQVRAHSQAKLCTIYTLLKSTDRGLHCCLQQYR